MENLPPKKGSGPWAVARGLFLEVPVTRGLAAVTVTREDCEAKFSHRFAIALRYTVASFLHRLSPSGALASILILFLRWFVFWVASVALLLVPMNLAAEYVASIASLLQKAASDLVDAVKNLCISAGMLALLCTLAVRWLKGRS